MKILLTAINAKYIHSNLAVYSLRAYAGSYKQQIELAEYTINHRIDFILQEIYKKKPDVLLFSCYIWNFSYVCQLVEEIHKLMPKLPIWVGGPEVSYECDTFLQEYPMVTGILRGEGEATFRELCRYYIDQCSDRENTKAERGKTEIEGRHDRTENELSKIRGIVYRNSRNEIVYTDERPALSMDDIPFCYEDLTEFEHRIIYYESSRGCPFRCSYCLSSVEKSLRFRSLALVQQELQFFLDKKVPQVKFVDRTFNCNHQHAMEIWRYIREHDNGVTNFHFEISADLLTEEEIAYIGTMRPGLIQLEIGVQSTNPATVEEIRRVMDLERLEEVVKQVKAQRNIHQHLDLIAGLPFEDYETFQQSFDRIYSLHPQQLQLGFLKVLKGSYMYENRENYGLVYQGRPPYEVMETNWISYDEILKIKNVEEMLEVYYNSGQFELTMQILEKKFDGAFEMFLKMGEFYEKNGLFFMNHSRIRRSEILLDFVREHDPEHLELYKETLTFDLYYRENMKSRPSWAMNVDLFKKEAKMLLDEVVEKCEQEESQIELQRKKQRKLGKLLHIEPFFYDFKGLLQGNQREYPSRNEKWTFYLFNYEKRSTLTGQAEVVRL